MSANAAHFPAGVVPRIAPRPKRTALLSHTPNTSFPLDHVSGAGEIHFKFFDIYQMMLKIYHRWYKYPLYYNISLYITIYVYKTNSCRFIFCYYFFAFSSSRKLCFSSDMSVGKHSLLAIRHCLPLGWTVFSVCSVKDCLSHKDFNVVSHSHVIFYVNNFWYLR